MIAVRSPMFHYTMQSRSLIGLLFAPTSTRNDIRAAFRRTVRQLRRLPLDDEQFARTYVGLRRVYRGLQRNAFSAGRKERAEARVIRLTLDVLTGCRAGEPIFAGTGIRGGVC
jgi:hypothetical protein